MDKIKFNDFDLFAYVSSGLAAIFAADLIFDRQVVGDLGTLSTQTILLLFAAYVAGHVVALPSYVLMEQLLLGELFWRPSVLLFRQSAPDVEARRSAGLPAIRLNLALQALRRLNLTEYGDALDPDVILRVRERFGAEGRAPVGNGRYWAVYPAIYAPAGKDEPRSDRLDLFGKVFNFARNLATVALLFAAATSAKHLAGYDVPPALGLGWTGQTAIALLLWLALTLRFLKFYHMHAVEMFVVYSQGARSVAAATCKRRQAPRDGG